MVKEFDIRVSPAVAANESRIKDFLIKDKSLRSGEISGIRILKKSIDARQKNIIINLRVRVFINESPEELSFIPFEYRDVSGKKSVIVVGAGPAGLFAALKLIELGIKPVLIERGKKVNERKIDIAQISRKHVVDDESNYSFGEGGAGAFSDGKLYTRSKKRGSVDKILQVLCQFGASESILVDAHPHIGTDKLPEIIANIRNKIIECGGEVFFQTRMDDILVSKNVVSGIKTSAGQIFEGPVILATGHSARDVYRLLHDKGIKIESKSLAMGVRLEHPQTLIDTIMYHNPAGRGEFLPAAEYSFVRQVDGRGVYSFCMCPGGFVVPAASGQNQVVVNGMSPSNRGSKWANSGMVVEIHPEDINSGMINKIDADLNNFGFHTNKYEHGGVLSLMNFQEKLENLCYFMGGSSQTSPAQRMGDFVNSKLSASLPVSSYTPGVKSSALHEWLPGLISGRLQTGFKMFDGISRGFLTNEALLLGVETRTSSPVRIIRDNETLEHIEIKGLYPCGEGAGYAGGIVSAAIDGERCAEMLGKTME